MKKKESNLFRWSIVKSHNRFVLVGCVFDDERFADNTLVTTSRLERIDFKKGIAETMNTIYHLA